MSENPKGKDNLGGLGVDGRMLVKTYLKYLGYGGVDWVHLPEERA
jgi:hypothetical protein